MHLSAWQKRWAGLILILLMSASSIQLGYLQGYAFFACEGTCGAPSRAFVCEAARIMEDEGLAETPGWRCGGHAVRAERAGQSGRYRGFLPDCCRAKGYSGAYTRIFLSSCRIENVCARSHALMMDYIHCQDGAKADRLF